MSTSRFIGQLSEHPLVHKGAAFFRRPGVSFYGKALTILLCAFLLADVVALFAEKLIPEPPTKVAARRAEQTLMAKRSRNMDEYSIIFRRNLFNSKGLIPGDDASPDLQPQDIGGPPTKTTLPFNLIGTLILKDEIRSLATIEDKSASTVYPVRIRDEIPGKARIQSVEPRRVIFLNLASGRREYIELPEEPELANPKITLGGPTLKPGPGGPGIEKLSPTQFNISRSEVDKALADLNNILTQARAVPNFENGVPSGYKLFQIVPGSIYDKLGLQNGDVIQGLDGEPINDPAKAWGKLSGLKEANHLELQIKRDGRPITNVFDIR